MRGMRLYRMPEDGIEHAGPALTLAVANQARRRGTAIAPFILALVAAATLALFPTGESR